MSDRSPDPIYLVGPTAVGKSDIAVELAERLGGEVVGADAFQVYRGLDLLTAKPSPATLRRVPHHLIAEVPLSQTFDVEQYRKLATERITAIAGRGRVPIVVGGSGLYVRALTQGLSELPSADRELRSQLEALPLPELHEKLRELDAATAAVIDLQNPRRVIRALEVCLLTARPFSAFRNHAAPAGTVRGVFLQTDRAVLRDRIAERTRRMFADGLVEEVRRAGEVSATAGQAIGYSLIMELLAGKLSERECMERITIQTQQYAKRQLTWFRRDSHWTHLGVTPGRSPTRVAEEIVTLLGVGRSAAAS
jgi:tRNA dimethylallyltransferase